MAKSKNTSPTAPAEGKAEVQANPDATSQTAGPDNTPPTAPAEVKTVPAGAPPAYVVVSHIKHNGTRYEPGSIAPDLDDETRARMLASGSIVEKV